MRAIGTQQSCTHFITLSIPLLSRAEDSGISTLMDATIWQITGSQVSCSSTTTTPVTKWKNHSFRLSFIPCSHDLEKETPILPSMWNSTWVKFQGAQLEGILPSFGHSLSTFSKTMTNHHHMCAPTWHFLGYDHRLHLYLLETSSLFCHDWQETKAFPHFSLKLVQHATVQKNTNTKQQAQFQPKCSCFYSQI